MVHGDNASTRRPMYRYLTVIKVNAAHHFSKCNYFWLWNVALVHNSLSAQFTCLFLSAHSPDFTLWQP